MCNRHYEHKRLYGDGAAKTMTPKGDPAIRRDGYVRVLHDGERRMQHVVIAEAALGKPLPAKAEVHHVDQCRSNNERTNLVICSQAYHKLLHQRMRARAAGVSLHWRMCTYCKGFDDPAALYISPRNAVSHRQCANANKRKTYAARHA